MAERKQDKDFESFFFGASPASHKLKEIVLRIAPTDLPVLILGEAGVGSELLARFIHNTSIRSDRPFVTVNLAAMPSGLISSELFGHQRGAFTGADKSRNGLIEIANGGTLLLDEIESLSLEVQAALLRFLADRTVRPIGSNRERTVDVRIIVTAGPDIMHSDSVRRDLLMRVAAGITISISPLRQRPEDIEPLAEHFLKSGGSGKTLDKSARDALSKYPFPGNVRELRVILDRAVAVSSGDFITESDLMLTAHKPMRPRKTANDIKRELSAVRSELDALRQTSIAASSIWEGRSFPMEKDYCFVLMPFADFNDVQAVYKNHVKRVVEKRCGLRCERADDIHDISGVMQTVWEGLNRARIIIADLTGGNSNVFYEPGIAHTLGKQVIMITQSMDYVPFDLRHRRCVVYEYKPKKINEFEARLEKTILRVLSSIPTPSMQLVQH